MNQALSQDVPLLGEARLTELRAIYLQREGDEPLERTDVRNAQLSALHFVHAQGLVPYTDFGV